MSDQSDQRDGAGRRQPEQPEPEADATGARSQRDAAVARVLAGADEQTRRNLEPMLARSSVLETIASVHGADEPLMVEDRPAKPDFLDTEEYAMARKAIGATGEPASVRAGAAGAARGSELADREAPRGTAEPNTGTSAQRSPARRLGLVIVLAAIAIAVVVLWWRSRPDVAVEPGTEPASSSAASPAETNRPSGPSSTAPAASQHAAAQSAAPNTPVDPSASNIPATSGPHPTARPPATPAPSLPLPPTSTTAPAPSRSSDLLFPPKD